MEVQEVLNMADIDARRREDVTVLYEVHTSRADYGKGTDWEAVNPDHLWC